MERHRWDAVVRLAEPDLQPGQNYLWGISGTTGDHVLRSLHDDIAVAGRVTDAPWAALVVRADRSVVATVSSTLGSGLFWSLDSVAGHQPALIVGARLGGVVTARAAATTLDHSYLLDFAHMRPTASGTPYAEVARISAATAAIWTRIEDAPRCATWCGPESWPEPTLSGDTARSRYLDAFDRAVDDLVVPGEPICAAMSGGLDSTFMVASLVRHASSGSPVHAFVHAPHPDATLPPIKGFDFDESHIAKEMERTYPGLVVVTKIVNEQLRHPLDAAHEVAARNWAPAVNAANLVWFSDIHNRAEALGASRVFKGGNGNAAFSHDHSYAARYHARRAEWRALLAMVRQATAHGVTLPSALRRRLVGPLLGPARATLRRRSRSYADNLSLRRSGSSAAPRYETRAAYLRWLRTDSGLPIATQPDDDLPLGVDPFSASRLLDVAAAITPAAWNDGPPPRGMARLLGEGRIPDPIRLRSRRGIQSSDSWFVVCNDRDRYLDEIDALTTTPVLDEAVDVAALRVRAESWSWGETIPPADRGYPTIDRLLALAIFIRMAQDRLSDRGATQRPATITSLNEVAPGC